MERKKKRFLRLPHPFKRLGWGKKRIAAAFAAMVLLVGGYFGGIAYLNTKKIFKGGGGAAALEENVDPTKLRGEGDGRVNILLLGRGGAGHEGEDLTDTILIASIDPIQKEAALLSIPRDLYVRTTSGGYSKINAVFANAKNYSLARTSSSDGARVQKADDAGFKAVEEIIQSKIGIPIHYHGIIDFEGFKKAIDTVGGIDINVPATGVVQERMRIDGRPYLLDVAQGPQHFDGMRALAYSRSRYTSARGDFDRSERQRMVMVALKNKILTIGTYGNPAKVGKLMGDFGNHISTNMSVSEVMRLYDIGKLIDSNKIASVGLADPPNNFVTTANINGLSVVIPRAGLDNYKEVQNFVRNRLKDSFLASENASVAIFNGTTVPGLASRTAEDLRSYGYNVTQVGDAPTQTYQQTTVVDLRGGVKKYTKRYLETRFKTTATGKLPDANITPGTADFVIILGQNEEARLGN
jgi:LCP family protein required for cell wall assembly